MDHTAHCLIEETCRTGKQCPGSTPGIPSPGLRCSSMRKTVYGETRKEAYEKVQKALLEHKQGLQATGPKQTVKQYLEYWLEHVHRQSIRLNSYVKVRELLDLHVLPAPGHLQVQKLTIQHVQAFDSELQQKLSASRIRFSHSTLHSALDDAVRTRLVAKNVCDSMALPGLVKQAMQVLTPEQARMMVETAKESLMEEVDGRVWRVEFSLKREALHGLQQEHMLHEVVFWGIEDAYELPEQFPVLWAFATGQGDGGPDGLPHGWLRCVVPNGDKNRSRWPMHPVWQLIQTAFIDPMEVPPQFGKIVRKRLQFGLPAMSSEG
jgi:hypothetical protein